MAEIIDLEEYRSKKAEQEIRELKGELESVIRSMDLTPESPSPYFPNFDIGSDYLSSPIAGSFGCPCCGLQSQSWSVMHEFDKDES